MTNTLHQKNIQLLTAVERVNWNIHHNFIDIINHKIKLNIINFFLILMPPLSWILMIIIPNRNGAIDRKLLKIMNILIILTNLIRQFNSHHNINLNNIVCYGMSIYFTLYLHFDLVSSKWLKLNFLNIYILNLGLYQSKSYFQTIVVSM